MLQEKPGKPGFFHGRNKLLSGQPFGLLRVDTGTNRKEIQMFKKPLVIATVTAALAMGAVSTQAAAADPLLGALIGGGLGAAIGHSVNGQRGGVVGGVLGAIVGSSIAADSNGYYDRGYYDSGYYDRSSYDSGYYAPAPAYYGPAYYPAPVVVYRSSPRYVYEPRYRSYGHDYRSYGHDYRSYGRDYRSYGRDYRSDNRDYRRVHDGRWH
jgi:hypothetical protein